MRAKEARLISIHDYLTSKGVYPTKTLKSGNELWYLSPIRCGDTSPSFKVDKQKNLWFDFGVALGGNSLDLICQLEAMTVKEALAFLSSSDRELIPNKNNHHAPIFRENKISNELKKIAGEKEKNKCLSVSLVTDIKKIGLIDYLKKRKISLIIAKKYLQEIHYKPANSLKSYYALGLPCGDGFEARSPFFKGFIGKHKDIARINLKSEQSLSIFEGVMDFLAFLTTYEKKDFKSSVIILNSINLKKRVLTEIENFNFSKVYLFLDNDEAGKNTCSFFQHYIQKKIPVIDKSFLYKDYQDFNEMVIEKESKK